MGLPWFRVWADLRSHERFRALDARERAVLWGLWMLACESDELGVVRGPDGEAPRYAGRGGLGDRLGLRPQDVRAALPRLVELRWVAGVGLGGVVPRSENDRRTAVEVVKNARVAAPWPLLLVGFRERNPRSLNSTERVRKHRAHKELRATDGAARDGPRASPETFHETFRKRQETPLDQDQETDHSPPAPPRGEGGPPLPRASPTSEPTCDDCGFVHGELACDEAVRRWMRDGNAAAGVHAPELTPDELAARTRCRACGQAAHPGSGCELAARRARRGRRRTRRASRPP